MAENGLLSRFQQQEAESLALAVRLQRWSEVMIQVMIREQEQKLVASDLPVEGESGAGFWDELH